MPQFLNILTFPNSASGASESAAPQVALSLGVAGTIPASASADTADFQVIVPFPLTITKIKAISKTAPSSNTTVQLRKSSDNGATFADVSGFSTTINSGAKTSTTTPTSATLAEGDVRSFSVTAGGGSGTNLMVEIIGTPR